MDYTFKSPKVIEESDDEGQHGEEEDNDGKDRLFDEPINTESTNISDTP